MKQQHSESMLVALARSPWWWSVALALSVYLSLRYVAPWLASSTEIHVLKVLLLALANAWWVSIVFLLPLPWSLYRWIRKIRR